MAGGMRDEGDDSVAAGSQAAPFRTIEHALARARGQDNGESWPARGATKQIRAAAPFSRRSLAGLPLRPCARRQETHRLEKAAAAEARRRRRRRRAADSGGGARGPIVNAANQCEGTGRTFR